MYAFAARGDCAAMDEPFYAAYLAATGLDHPMREAVLASQSTDPEAVARLCAADAGAPLIYQKHMVLHLLPHFPRDWMRECAHVLLIRHPARVVASYARKREAPTAADLGFLQGERLWEEIAGLTGSPPPVLSAESVRADPRAALSRLCAALDLPFTDRMLSWPAGPKPFDGAWAPHWYGAVHRSTGFEPPEGEPPALEGEYARLAAEGMAAYERLLARAL
ncbi:HAD family hydrolase [Rubellimicrobium sp. CFH 75288]|nr:HAD family hydrolase [Rubellimicrobium sp. CFH 75288]